VIPFANWTFFGVLVVYALVPVLVLGLLGKASARWCFIATLPVLGFIYSTRDTAILQLGSVAWPELGGPEILRPWAVEGAATRFSPFYVFLLSAVYQWALALAFLRWKSRRALPFAIALAVLPLVLAKALPLASEHALFGYLGISYVTFRALDVVFSIHDGVIKSLAPGQLFAFLFFFPCVSSGPIDRYRRFEQDWQRTRTRAEFLDDLDFAIQRIARGFLYKFILAALLDRHVLEPVEKAHGFWPHVGYMYGYTLYLFFDFAGYSAFAVGISRLLGVQTPENFHAPFLARNIRDFWARWHMSLSFWLRDHVHMRFQLAAMKGRWFSGKNTAGYLGVLLTFGLMGVWHGLESHYLLYGLYHAVLVSGYDWFARWNKQAKRFPDGPGWRVFDMALTFHAVAFGMLLFSGHLMRP
jgi:membrane protein involved in D-alanine export